MIGFSRFDAVWITNTPPMNIEITPTRRIDESMSLSDSFTSCLQNILAFSGLRKTILRNRKYSPTETKIFFSMRKIYFMDAKINIFLFLMSIFGYSCKICPRAQKLV